MQNRFHTDPLVQATELLLQERIPRGVPAAHPRAEEVLTRPSGSHAHGFDDARVRHGGFADAAHAVAFEWNLQRDDYDRRRRLFAMRTDGGHALARRS